MGFRVEVAVGEADETDCGKSVEDRDARARPVEYCRPWMSAFDKIGDLTLKANRS